MQFVRSFNCLPVGSLAAWVYFHLTPPWVWKNGRRDILAFVCSLLAVLASVTVTVATFSDTNFGL